MLASLVLALSVAFPRPGGKLPPVDACYVIGSVEAGTTNVTVAGQSVAVHPSGAWATLVPVRPGTNTLLLSAVEGGVRREWCRSFCVAAKPKPSPSAVALPPAKPRTYEKLAFAADEAQKHPAGRPASDVTVVLDPGHGGNVDLGALSPHGWCEKDANLNLAKDVRSALMRRGYRVVLTRSDDRAVALYDRPKVAHSEKAAAFVSLHYNAPPVDRPAGQIRYACVYAWNPLGQALAETVAKRMSEAQGGELPGKGALLANYAVTRNPQIPSCLVEVDFITHPEGEAAAWDPARRAAVAEAIASGIADWHHLPSQ